MIYRVGVSFHIYFHICA